MIRYRRRRCRSPYLSGEGNVFVSPENSQEAIDAIPVRRLIEDELRRNGVVLESPCVENTFRIESMYAGDEPMDVSTAIDSEKFQSLYEPPATHYITEEELFDLSEAIEFEIQTEATKFLEEMIEMENQNLYEQVADFEQWQDIKVNDQFGGCFLCPICQRANIDVITTDVNNYLLVCPNYSTGNCSMHLDGLHGQSPMELQNRLATTFVEHSNFCPKNLKMSVINNSSSHSTLFACCDSCFYENLIL